MTSLFPIEMQTPSMSNAAPLLPVYFTAELAFAGAGATTGGVSIVDRNNVDDVDDRCMDRDGDRNDVDNLKATVTLANTSKRSMILIAASGCLGDLLWVVKATVPGVGQRFGGSSPRLDCGNQQASKQHERRR
jgi:hypothetical protein